MKETVLITGGHGFVAGYLAPQLEQQYKVKLLTRNPQADNEYRWDLEKWTMDEEALEDVDYIIHLSGSKFNDGSPLTEERKKLILDTRIGAADFLREKLKARNQKLTSFVSASAIGYYDFSDETLEIDEGGNKGTDFGAEVCDEWEKAADKFKTQEVAEYVCKIRVSLVLGNDGGAFTMFKENVKNNPDVVEKADQEVAPWNHVEDMAGIFAFAVAQNLDGVYNSVAPMPASQQDIFKAIANNIWEGKYNIKPFTGKHLVSHKIIEAGYTFIYPEIEQAISNIINKD